jgi:hypothetical protein
MIQVELNDVYIDIGANSGSEKLRTSKISVNSVYTGNARNDKR